MQARRRSAPAAAVVAIGVLVFVAKGPNHDQGHARPRPLVHTSMAPGTGPKPSSAAGSTTSQRPDVISISERSLSPRVAHIAPRVYVPNNHSNTVDVIDPKTFRIVRSFPIGIAPQHVTPAWDLRHLYVGNTYSNTLTVIDPRTARPIRTIPFPDPYNLYFTPDGRLAVDVAERLQTLFFYDPHTWRPRGSVRIPWSGPDHMDFSRDGRYLLISTEFAGTTASTAEVRASR